MKKDAVPLQGLAVTPAGWAAAVAVPALWVLGAELGYPAFIVVAAGILVALVLAAGFVAWKPRVRLDRSFYPTTVTAGDRAVALLEVRNLSARPTPPLIVVDRLGAERVELPVGTLRGAGTGRVRYDLPTVRRARLELGPLEVVRSDPLGLLRFGQRHGHHAVLWVHPKTWPMGALPAGVVVDLEGPVSDTAPAGSVTFSTLREYVPGDDRRYIHWKASARLGTLLVRHHVDTNEPRATLVLDARQSVWTPDTFEAGVEVAASVAAAMARGGREVHLTILGESPGHAQEIGALTVPDRLAAASTCPLTDPQELLATVEREEQTGGLVIVSGRLEPEVETRLGVNRKRFSPVIICKVEEGARATWRRRQELTVLHAPDAAHLSEAWNRMIG